MYYYEDCQGEYFIRGFQTDLIDGKPLQYVAFCKADNRHKIPIVLFGGALQNFASFKETVEFFIDDVPIILISLPGYGYNYYVDTEITINDLAHIMAAFLQKKHISQIMLVGISVGACIAATFASLYPEYIYKTILVGFFPILRPYLRFTFEHYIGLLEKKQIEEFSLLSANHLVNIARDDIIKHIRTLRNNIYKEFSQLSELAIKNFINNINRLLVSYHTPKPLLSPVLAISADLDNYILPFESSAFINLCPQGQLAIIKKADHLPWITRSAIIHDLYKNFYNDLPLEHLEALTGVKSHICITEKRQQPRWEMATPIKLQLTPTYNITGHTCNMSYDGCLLKPDQDILDAQNNHLLRGETSPILTFLDLPKEKQSIKAFSIIMSNQSIRCIFLRDKNWEGMKSWLQEKRPT